MAVSIDPPIDWSDMKGWDHYFQGKNSDKPFRVPTAIGAQGWESVRFISFVTQRGDRVWFPGCGIDPGPRFYAFTGSSVVATDISAAAVRAQQGFGSLSPEVMFEDWPAFAKSNAPIKQPGSFTVAQQDFRTCRPPGVFDVVINCRAFQGLPPSDMSTAAKQFFAALRPGGAAIVDTINVQGKLRDHIEDSLLSAGFFLPFHLSERWYRNQLENTGIVYEMVLGRPLVPYRGQCPTERFDEYRARDEKTLSSFRGEYEARLAAEKPSVEKALDSPDTIVAYAVYPTG